MSLPSEFQQFPTLISRENGNILWDPKITILRVQGLSSILKKWNTRPQQVPINFIPAFRVPSEVSILLLWASGGNFGTSWRLKPWRQRKMAFNDGEFPVGFSDHVWCHSSRPCPPWPLSWYCKYDKVLIMTFWDFQQFPMSISRDIVISKTYWIIGTSPCKNLAKQLPSHLRASVRSKGT